MGVVSVFDDMFSLAHTLLNLDRINCLIPQLSLLDERAPVNQLSDVTSLRDGPAAEIT